MQLLSTLATLALFALATSPAAHGNPQRFTGSGPSPLPPGQPLSVVYSNPAEANQLVTIKVHNSTNPEQEQTLEVVADANGVVRTNFEVPIDWGAVILTNPNSADFRVTVAWDV